MNIFQHYPHWSLYPLSHNDLNQTSADVSRVVSLLTACQGEPFMVTWSRQYQHPGRGDVSITHAQRTRLPFKAQALVKRDDFTVFKFSDGMSITLDTVNAPRSALVDCHFDTLVVTEDNFLVFLVTDFKPNILYAYFMRVNSNFEKVLLSMLFTPGDDLQLVYEDGDAADRTSHQLKVQFKHAQPS